ncbi:putative cellulose synthase (UDP-forming) [Helianthus anomalus]
MMGFDDLDNEFDLAESVLSAHLNNGRGPYASGYAGSEVDGATLKPEIPLLTYGQEDDGISADKHALIIPPFMNRAKRVHPMPFSDTASSVSCKY